MPNQYILAEKPQRYVTQSLVLWVCFVDRCLFFWPLRYLSFDLQILINTLVSSNSSWTTQVPCTCSYIFTYNTAAINKKRNVYFSNSCHLEWRVHMGMSDTNLKGDNPRPRTIRTKFGLIRGLMLWWLTPLCGSQLFYWWRKSLTCSKSMTNFITTICIKYTDYKGSCKSK